jgi:hypothetical protein
VTILLGFLGLSVGAIAWRWREIPVSHEEEPPFLAERPSSWDRRRSARSLS